MIIAIVVFAALVAITGALALGASNGFVPPLMRGIAKMSVVGTINSYAMIVAGIVLLVVGIMGWGCQLKKENKLPAS